MNKGKFISDITRLLFTLILCGALYILKITTDISLDPHLAVKLYYTIPKMVEYITASITVYLILSTISAYAYLNY